MQTDAGELRLIAARIDRTTSAERNAWIYVLLILALAGVAGLVVAAWYAAAWRPVATYSTNTFIFAGVCDSYSVVGALYKSGNQACLFVPRFTCNGTLNTTIIIGASQAAGLAAPLPTGYTPLSTATTSDGQPQAVVLFTTSAAGPPPLSQRLSTAYVTNEVSPPMLLLGVGLDDITIPVPAADVYGPAQGIDFCYPTSTSAGVTTRRGASLMSVVVAAVVVCARAHACA